MTNRLRFPSEHACGTMITDWPACPRASEGLIVMLMRTVTAAAAVTIAAAGIYLQLHPGRVQPDKDGVPVEERQLLDKLDLWHHLLASGGMTWALRLSPEAVFTLNADVWTCYRGTRADRRATTWAARKGMPADLKNNK